MERKRIKQLPLDTHGPQRDSSCTKQIKDITPGASALDRTPAGKTLSGPETKSLTQNICLV